MTVYLEACAECFRDLFRGYHQFWLFILLSSSINRHLHQTEIIRRYQPPIGGIYTNQAPNEGFYITKRSNPNSEYLI